MSKRTRQYIGILAALAAYYLVHEGAHLLYALFAGVLKQIKFMGLGVQIDVCAERMTDTQLGIFCLVGALATFCVGYLLAALAKNVCRAQSKLLRAMRFALRTVSPPDAFTDGSHFANRDTSASDARSASSCLRMVRKASFSQAVPMRDTKSS